MQKTTTPAERVVLWFMPSVPVLVFVLVFSTTLYFMPTLLNGDGDIGRHLTVGNVILDTRQIPSQDIFSHTMTGAQFVPNEWLSEVLFALAHRAAGMNGVTWLTALILASTFSLLTWGLVRLGVRAPIAFSAGVIASIVSALHALPRPHILTWLIFTLFMLALEDNRLSGRRRWLAVLPLLMLAWANLHGAFIAGLTLVLFYALGAGIERDGRRLATLLGLLAILVITSWINPIGSQLIGHNAAYLGERFLVDVTIDFQSPDFHMLSTWPFASLILLSLLLVWKGSTKLAWTVLVLIGGWTAFGLYSARNIPLYAIVATTVLAPVADNFAGELLPVIQRTLTRLDEIDHLARGWIWAIGVVVLLVGLENSGSRLDVWHAGNTFGPKSFPVAAVDALQVSPPEGNMFNEFTWGGYLLYRLWPTKRVFIDGITDFYGEALTREYLKVASAEPGWDATLDRYDVRWVIVRRNSPLAAQLDKSAAWSIKYEDSVAGVWVRK